MGRVLLIIAVVLLTIYCIVEVAQSRSWQVRALPRWLWAFVVILVPVLGPVTWLLAGRPVSGPGPGFKGPDDDDDFLRGIH